MVYQAIVLMFGLCMALTSFAQQAETKDAPPRTVTVRGMGAVTTPPDQVRLGVQVQTRAESATEAMAAANARTRQVLAILKAQGVGEKEIQTSRSTVNAIVDYQRNIQPPPIVGYNGVNEFSVLFKGPLMEKVGTFMDKAIAAGATGFGGLQYETSIQRSLEREALKKAASDARARAEVLATELGASLGKAIKVSELSVGPAPLSRGIMMAEGSSAGAPIMSGELTVTAQAEVVFELK
jgi:uncharacterized protein YggE